MTAPIGPKDKKRARLDSLNTAQPDSIPKPEHGVMGRLVRATPLIGDIVKALDDVGKKTGS